MLRSFVVVTAVVAQATLLGGVVAQCCGRRIVYSLLVLTAAITDGYQGKETAL